MPLSEEELHKIHMKLRKGRAKMLRARGCGDLAKVLEDENITSDDIKEMTKRTKRKTEERIAQLNADTKAIQEQNRKEARAAKRQRRELESQLDALLTQRKRTRDV